MKTVTLHQPYASSHRERDEDDTRPGSWSPPTVHSSGSASPSMQRRKTATE